MFEEAWNDAHHDELERDWDEPYYADDVEDDDYVVDEDRYLDASYEDRYDLGDY